jgi:hypothetical protein
MSKFTELNTSQATLLTQPEASISQSYQTWLCQNVVKKGSKFAYLAKPDELLAREELVGTLKHNLEPLNLEKPVLRQSIEDAVTAVSDPFRNDGGPHLCIWGGRSVFDPSSCHKLVPTGTGTVMINTYNEPAFRAIPPAPTSQLEPFLRFFEKIFRDPQERAMVCGWIASSLKGGKNRPSWALIAYSSEKGTGKSTLGHIIARLHGATNSMTIAGLDKFTQRFNAPTLAKTFVSVEELGETLPPKQIETAKALLTGETIATERKLSDTHEVALHTSVYASTNRLPTYLNELERRFLLVDASHSGHASGPDREDFAALIQEIRGLLDDTRVVSALYKWFMNYNLPTGFEPTSVNVATQSTALMRQVAEAGRVEQRALLQDLEGVCVVAHPDLEALAKRRYQMSRKDISTALAGDGWHKRAATWGDQACRGIVWVRDGCTLTDGYVHGPGVGHKQALVDHFAQHRFD